MADAANRDFSTEREEQITWYRLEPVFSVGTGKKWQLVAALPADLRRLVVDARDASTGEALPTEKDTEVGVSDGRLLVQRFSFVGDERVTIGGGLGTTVPTGRGQFQAGASALERWRMGAGMPVPLATFNLVVVSGKVGANAFATGRFPVLRNTQDYRAARGVSGGLGPTFTLLPGWRVLTSVEGLVEGPDDRNGDYFGNPGRAALFGGLMSVHKLDKRWVGYLQGRVTPWQSAGTGKVSDEILPDVLVAAGVSWFSGKKKDDDDHGDEDGHDHGDEDGHDHGDEDGDDHGDEDGDDHGDEDGHDHGDDDGHDH